MRTTISLDLPILRKIREIGHREHKTFTQVVRELLALAISSRNKHPKSTSPFHQWHSRNMGALFDYRDKEALYKVLDQRP